MSPPWRCYFLQHTQPSHWKIAIQRSLTSFQAVRSSDSLAFSWERADYHHGSGGGLRVASPSPSNMWAALIRPVNRLFWSAFAPSFSSLAPAPLPSVHPQWSRKNQDPDRQDTCTYTSDTSVWLVPGSVPFSSWSHDFSVRCQPQFVFGFCSVPGSIG